MSESNKPEAAGKVLGDFQNIGDAARQTGQQARQAGAQAVDHAKDAAQEVRGRAASLAGAVGEQANAAAESQKSNLAGALEDAAKAVHRSGEQLEGQQDWIAHLVEHGADELSALATTLRSNDLQSLLGELGSLARRQPALFVGASMAAGFALTRVGRIAASGAVETASEAVRTAATSQGAGSTGTAPNRAAPNGATLQGNMPAAMPGTPSPAAPVTVSHGGPAGTSEGAHERG
ncbi:MAG TPA: hypothetical protein VHO91_23075 [Rhodopila sp.]|nr:hypothetical protein [Rhodopila sp.]